MKLDVIVPPRTFVFTFDEAEARMLKKLSSVNHTTADALAKKGYDSTGIAQFLDRIFWALAEEGV